MLISLWASQTMATCSPAFTASEEAHDGVGTTSYIDAAWIQH